MVEMAGPRNAADSFRMYGVLSPVYGGRFRDR